MAEETEGLTSIAKVIPSIYYDLIARVCAGVPFIAVLLWDKRSDFGDVTWSKLALLLGAGYLFGLIITPLSLPWIALQVVVRRVVKEPKWDWRTGPSFTDQIDAIDKEASATLAKMAAEMVLCENLVSGYVLLLIIHATHPLFVLSQCSAGLRTAILILLAVCSAHRVIAYVGRENRLIHLYFDPVTGEPRR